MRGKKNWWSNKRKRDILAWKKSLEFWCPVITFWEIWTTTAHTHVHTHTKSTSGELLSKGQEFCLTQRGVKEQEERDRRKKKKSHVERKKSETVQIELGDRKLQNKSEEGSTECANKVLLWLWHIPTYWVKVHGVKMQKDLLFSCCNTIKHTCRLSWN